MTAARASKNLLRMLPSNAEERRVILDILGVSSVLETEEHRGFPIRFTRFDERRLPAHRFVDQAYPVCWWTGANGVNDHALREFGLL